MFAEVPPIACQGGLLNDMISEEFRLGKSASLDCSFFYVTSETSYMILDV
jgi:hypothetical protein